MRSAVSVATGVEPISVEFLAAHHDLLRSHWSEVDGRDRFDVDWKRYRVLAAQELLLLLGAMDAGELRGYSIGVVIPHHHRRGITYYQNEGLFVEPSARGAGFGLELVRATEQHAMQRGATVFSWHARRDSALDRLLSARQYQEREVIFQREIH